MPSEVAPPEVLTIGETMIMVTPTTPAPLVSARDFSLAVGGAESNVALYLQELGHPTTWVSRLGDDALGHRILATLAGHGVDVSFVTLDPHAPTGLYVKDPSEGSTRVHYYRSGSAASHMAADLTATLPIEDVLLVHLTGITPGLSRSCADLIDAVVERVRGTSALLSFDVNYRPGLWPVGTAAPVLARLANGADIVLVGLDEAKALWGTATPAQVRELLPQPSRLVVKSGADGATEFLGETQSFVATPPVDVVEVVGAGDAFAAGYLASLLDGAPSHACLRSGHALAARALTTTSDYAHATARR